MGRGHSQSEDGMKKKEVWVIRLVEYKVRTREMEIEVQRRLDSWGFTIARIGTR